MARYKPPPPGVGDPPRVNQRIDDVIYTYNRQTNTLNSWHYPTGKNKQRFQQINGLVQQLDRQYAGLSPTDQAAWTAGFSQDSWNIFCWIWQEDDTPKPPDSPGLANFRSTNLCRFDQGLATVTTPPTHAPVPLPDDIQFMTPQWSVKPHITIAPYIYNVACSVYGYPATHEPSLGEPPSSNFKYIGTLTIPTNTWTDLSSFLDASGAFGTAPFKVIEVRIGFPGCVAEVRGRTSA
jgi:hypothetical protein